MSYLSFLWGHVPFSKVLGQSGPGILIPHLRRLARTGEENWWIKPGISSALECSNALSLPKWDWSNDLPRLGSVVPYPQVTGGIRPPWHPPLSHLRNGGGLFGAQTGATPQMTRTSPVIKHRPKTGMPRGSRRSTGGSQSPRPNRRHKPQQSYRLLYPDTPCLSYMPTLTPLAPPQCR